MTRPSNPTKTTRKQYSEEYRKDVLALALKVGVSVAAKQLGLHPSQIYGWRSKVKLHQSQEMPRESLPQRMLDLSGSWLSRQRSWQS
ncbi:transposase [Microbulbifer sp. JMSA004]|uniref:transposase n=1 Tax=Microbulbifer sp. JMSA004 TaxID=3243370 RepID=UPI00403A71D4